jgi:hypothetical protein
MSRKLKSDRFTYQDFQRWMIFVSLFLSVFLLSSLMATRSHADNKPVTSQEETTQQSNQVIANTIDYDNEVRHTRWNVNYFSILFGPGVGDFSSYQPTEDGTHDPNRPVLTKNFLNLGYDVDDNVRITASAYWLYQPVLGQDFVLRDPSLRVSHAALINTGPLNLYADLRAHFPVTTESRDEDMLAGFQSVQVLSYRIGDSRLTLGSYASERLNVFGSRGNGDDFTIYLGPNAYYQMTPTLALTALYEINGSHAFGQKIGELNDDGSDFETGVSWDINPSINLSPYLNFRTDTPVNADTTSIGATFSWQLI